MKIYTGFGDKGKTMLFGGQVVDKDHPRVKAYGSLDELNSWLGLIAAEEPDSDLEENLRDIQNKIFNISSELATPPENKNAGKLTESISNKDFILLEKLIDRIQDKLPPLKNFILPGGSKLSSYYHIARTVCRRAERYIVGVKRKSGVNENIEIYINRLSDLLFVLARYANKNKNVEDVLWKK